MMGVKKVACEWKGDMVFDAELDGHTIRMDDGAGNTGARPKGLLLVGLAGCTGFDVSGMLKKMRQDVTSMKIEVEANETDDIPSVYDTITIHYIFEGNNLDEAKLERAVMLSKTKYCGVSAMLDCASDIQWKISVSSPEQV